MRFLSKVTKPFAAFVDFFVYLTDELGTLFYDTFTDSNGTALTAHTPDIDTVGGGWIDVLGTSNIDIQANVATLNANSYYHADVGRSNVRVTCDIIKEAFTASQGIVLRSNNNTNHWKCERDNSPAQIHIVETVAAVETVRAFSNLGNAVGGTFNFVAEMSGQDITLEVTGAATVSLSYGSAANFISQTNFGITGIFGAGIQRYDNFLVEAIP